MTLASSLTAPPHARSAMHPFMAGIVLTFLACPGFADENAHPEQLLLESHCVACHNSDLQSGGVDLTPLTQEYAEEPDQADEDPVRTAPKIADLWTRVEHMVATGKMPPVGEERLTDNQKQTVTKWYRENYILRDGIPHIGITPLRRLTRYELENTLEDLLHVKLKHPYAFSAQMEPFRPSTIEQLYPADAPGASGFDNDAAQLARVQIPILELMACVDFALRKFDQSEAARQQVLGFRDKSTEITLADARKILQQFAQSATRGKLTDEELQRLVNAWEKTKQEFTSYEALLATMKLSLLSPSFIYRLEDSRQLRDPYAVSGSELAVRLSYFLWSAPPDEALMQAAADGSLMNDAGLQAQIQRMLNSPKRIALAENLAGQWLGFDELRRNKDLDEGQPWTRQSYDQLLFAFDELVRSDRSVLEIVDSDWVFLNPREAKSLGAKPLQVESLYADIFAPRRSRAGLKVENFYTPPELFKLESDQLGGMLTTPGVMRLTSAPNRTNPIRRGVWLMRNVMGEQLHPPENIPPLAEAEKKLAEQLAEKGMNTASVRDILREHTRRESCRSCHQHIDPLGLGLENFSPRGQWRSEYAPGEHVVAGGVLPNAREFSTPKQLKQELLNCYQDQIVDNIIRQMLAYAVGRELQPYDRVTIEQIRRQLEANNFRMGLLIEQIVLSQQFRYRQDSL